MVPCLLVLVVLLRTLSTPHVELKQLGFAGHRYAVPHVPKVARCVWDDTRIAFGKHRGDSYGNVAKIDPVYCQFILDLDNNAFPIQRFRQYLKSNFKPPALEDTVIGFGKHKGTTYSELAANEPGYCEFVLGLANPGHQAAKLQAFLRDYSAKEGSVQTQAPEPVEAQPVQVAATPKSQPKPFTSKAQPFTSKSQPFTSKTQPFTSKTQPFTSKAQPKPFTSKAATPGTSIKADAGSTTVTMGKHRGRTFEHVWMNEKGYVQFVLGQEEPFGQMKDMKEYFTQQR